MFSYKRESFSENQQHQVLFLGPTQGRMIPRTATFPIELDLCRYLQFKKKKIAAMVQEKLSKTDRQLNATVDFFSTL